MNNFRRPIFDPLFSQGCPLGGGIASEVPPLLSQGRRDDVGRACYCACGITSGFEVWPVGAQIEVSGSLQALEVLQVGALQKEVTGSLRAFEVCRLEPRRRCRDHFGHVSLPQFKTAGDPEVEVLKWRRGTRRLVSTRNEIDLCYAE